MDDTAKPDSGVPTPPDPGARIAGRYRLVRRIGGGGIGDVFEAFDEHLERRVAIKVMKFAGSGDISAQEIFDKTSRILAQLSHPGIVPLHEAGEDQGRLFLVMDLVDGTSLSDVLLRVRQSLGTGPEGRVAVPRDAGPLAVAIGRPLPKGRRDLVGERSWYRAVAAIAVELAGVLEAAHDAGVVHRDLKPGNVMLLGGGEPVVLDFDRAGRLDAVEGAVTQSLTGTVAYLAPEQVKNYRIGTDPRSDVYQLGLMLYELLTLRRAFPGSVATEVLARISCGVFTSPRRQNPGVPRDLEAICLKSFELNPDLRYQSARELREDLRCYLDGRAVPTAVRGSLGRKVTRTGVYLARRHPVVAAGVLVLVTATVALAGSDWRRPSEETSFGSAFRTSKEGATTLLKQGDEVQIGDVLGVTVEAGDPCFVYSFSVFGGERMEDRWVRPCTGRAKDAETLDETSWALHLPKGRHSVEITQLDDGSVPAGHWEGILAFVSTSSEPWLERVSYRIDPDKNGSLQLPQEERQMSYPQAIQLISEELSKEPPLSRGGPLSPETPIRLRRLRALLKQEHLDVRAPWPEALTDLKRKYDEWSLGG